MLTSYYMCSLLLTCFRCVSTAAGEEGSYFSPSPSRVYRRLERDDIDTCTQAVTWSYVLESLLSLSTKLESLTFFALLHSPDVCLCTSKKRTFLHSPGVCLCTSKKRTMPRCEQVCVHACIFLFFFLSLSLLVHFSGVCTCLHVNTRKFNYYKVIIQLL